MHKDVSALIEKKIKQAYKLRQEINDIKNRNKISKAASVYNENLRDCRVHYGSRASKELAQYIDQTSIFITEGKVCERYSDQSPKSDLSGCVQYPRQIKEQLSEQ